MVVVVVFSFHIDGILTDGNIRPAYKKVGVGYSIYSYMKRETKKKSAIIIYVLSSYTIFNNIHFYFQEICNKISRFLLGVPSAYIYETRF